MKNYLQLAQKIVRQHSLQKYLDILLGYWEKNPTTLGHGFEHAIKVAVESYEIAQLNNYSQPDELFVAGLFHDIYRPAEDKAGNEDQTLGAKITRKLFKENKVDPGLTAKICGAIESHDSWRGKKDAPEFDVLLSLGDKAAFDYVIAYAYVWASNKFTSEQKHKPFFSNYLQTLYFFQLYQLRAWEIFIKHPLKGSERGIAGYLHTYKVSTENYLHDKHSKHFFRYVEKIAELVRKEETKYLNHFLVPQEKIKQLMTRFY